MRTRRSSRPTRECDTCAPLFLDVYTVYTLHSRGPVAAKRTPKNHSTKRRQQSAPAVMETKVFKTGNSYAVRLPKALYSGGEAPVYVQRLDNGKLLIMPKLRRKWPSGFLESFGHMPDDFEAPLRPPADTLDDAGDAKLFDED